MKIFGWVIKDRYIMDNESRKKYDMPDNLISVTNMKHAAIWMTLQVLEIQTTDPKEYLEQFDFDVCKVFYNPNVRDGKIIGLDDNKPEISHAAMEKIATYTEHAWDYIKSDGMKTLNVKAINRLRKYGFNKGFRIVASEKSYFTTAQLYDMMNGPSPQIKKSGFYNKYEAPFTSISEIADLEHIMWKTVPRRYSECMEPGVELIHYREVVAHGGHHSHKVYFAWIRCLIGFFANVQTVIIEKNPSRMSKQIIREHMWAKTYTVREELLSALEKGPQRSTPHEIQCIKHYMRITW